VGEEERNPSNSRLERGRGVGGDSGMDWEYPICKKTLISMKKYIKIVPMAQTTVNHRLGLFSCPCRLFWLPVCCCWFIVGSGGNGICRLRRRRS
jgi:hypothetical protein